MVPWLVVACLHAIARKPALGAICQSRLAPHLISSAPILFGFSLHRWRIRIFDFQPKRRAARAIDRAEPLRHDSLAAKLAGLAEYNRAVPLEMLVEHDAQIWIVEQFC